MTNSLSPMGDWSASEQVTICSKSVETPTSDDMLNFDSEWKFLWSSFPPCLQEAARGPILKSTNGLLPPAANAFLQWTPSSFPQQVASSLNGWTPQLVATIYIMYSRQLPWGILISYRKWNEIYFISFTAKISFLISFLHSVYFILPWNLFHSLVACISFSHGIYFIHSWHLFHL